MKTTHSKCHARVPAAAILSLTLTLVVVIQAGALRAAELMARKIVSTDDLCRGKGAAGAIGDYLLTNGLIKVIIDDVTRRNGFAESGGNLLDVAWTHNNIDLITQVITYFDNTFPRQAVYDSIRMVADGSDGKAAVVRSSGVELRNKDLRVETDFILEPDKSYIRLRTTLTNTGRSAVRDFELGDAIQWGFTDHFAPGYGTNIGGQTTSAEWLGGVGEGISYGYTAKAVGLFGPNGGNWSDVNVASVNIAPGASVSYERYVIAGSGDLGSLLPVIFQLRAQNIGFLAGEVFEEGTAQPVKSAKLSIQNAGEKPYAIVQVGSTGRFKTPVPPGNYTVRVSDIGRSSPRPVKAQVEAGGATDLRLFMSAEGRIAFQVLDETTQRPTPSKLTFRGLSSTLDPTLGPSYQTRGAINVIFTHLGSGESVMPPGIYEVTASRGLEYTLHRQRMRVDGGKTTPVRAAIRRVVNTSGYISGDFHLHSENSPDSSISLRDKIIDLVAEGVEFAVATDHNYITDYSQAIRELVLESQIKSTIGNEITVTSLMHFNAFPLKLFPDRPKNGAIEVKGKTAGQMFDELRRQPGEKIIQVNHPRAGDIGYFNSMNLDPQTGKSSNPKYSGAFDAIEVFNGKRVTEAEIVLQDWYNFLNQGLIYTATGNSDSHHLVAEEAGYPRNFVWLGTDDPAAVDEMKVVEAIRRHRVVVSNGPFITFTCNGTNPVGSTVSAKGKASFEVSVQAAPWVDVSEVVLIGNGEIVAQDLVPESNQVQRLSKNYQVTPGRDTWYVVLVRGNRSLDPVIPPLGDRQVLPLAFTNPIWIDADGDGKFDALNAASRDQ